MAHESYTGSRKDRFMTGSRFLEPDPPEPDRLERDRPELDRPEPDRPELDRPTRLDRTGAKSAEQRLPIKDQGLRALGQGPRTKDHGPCFGMNEHPRRDTDVISRRFKSTIEDLSFYIGFVTSWILDLVLA